MTPRRRYDRASQAARLAAVRAAAGRQGAVVVGHSFGAGRGGRAGAARSARVSRLVLVDAALGRARSAAAERGVTGWALGQSWIAQPVTSASMTNPMLTGRMLRSMLARKEAADAWVETIRQPMRRRGHDRRLCRLAAGAVRQRRRRPEPPQRRGCGGSRVPVHLIWGEADTVTPIAQGETLARLMRRGAASPACRGSAISRISRTRRGFLAALDAAIGEAR